MLSQKVRYLRYLPYLLSLPPPIFLNPRQNDRRRGREPKETNSESYIYVMTIHENFCYKREFLQNQYSCRILVTK